MMKNAAIRVGFFYRVLPSYRLAIMEELARQPGIDLTVYYSSEPSYYSLKTVDPGDRFPSRRIAMKAWRVGGQEILYQPDVKTIVASGKHDVIVLPGNPRLLSNFAALRIAKRNRVGVVWWSLGIMPSQSKVTLFLRRVLMKVPHALVFYTEAERAFYDAHGLPGSRIFVAQNTIGVTEERAAAAKWTPDLLSDFARDNGFHGKKVFLFCGQIREKKRVDWLFRAFSIMRQSRRNDMLFLIGPDGTHGLAARFVSDLKLSDSVRFLGPIYGADALAPWFLSARALVVPRAIGLAALHGFAFGLPCITSRDPRHQTPELVALNDGFNCFLYDDGNLDDLSAKMALLAGDDAVLKEMSANARRTMDEEFTTGKMVAGFVQAIHYAHDNACKE